jgi:anaerobic selenocysteine-containing dehydrogenase
MGVAITGCPVEEIEAFARLVGETKRTFFRSATASRARATARSTCMRLVHSGGDRRLAARGRRRVPQQRRIYHWNKTLIEGLDVRDPSVRMLDQSRIGAILTGDREAWGGPPCQALLIQNTNPVSVAPEQDKVKQGFAREDLFVCVHEQFMTETARMADIVLPATMFLEHDDIYQGGGHQYIISSARSWSSRRANAAPTTR